ncbi:hypothetical protein AVEN_99347-1 [Araneus ventricosus]|uniref:Uncharacterized protein n=1 Tax=Araneus ventricosus TaxID=182803 RepID=A0A4Y2TR93_ARAVE|nr:hypothetical protein AVEN_99347-1 [Araneus ventricosus]
MKILSDCRFKFGEIPKFVLDDEFHQRREGIIMRLVSNIRRPVNKLSQPMLCANYDKHHLIDSKKGHNVCSLGVHWPELWNPFFSGVCIPK